MSKFLIISIIAKDKRGLAEQFSNIASNHKCNISDSRMAIMGQEFSVTMLLSGTEENIAACETDYAQLAAQAGHLFIARRTEANADAVTSLAYSISTLSLDAPGIISNITDFLRRKEINISNLNANSYKAPHTGSPMLEVELSVNIPNVIHLAKLRDEFIEFCDELHIYATFEPIK